MQVGIESVALALDLVRWLAYKGLIVSSPQHFIQSVLLEHVCVHTHTRPRKHTSIECVHTSLHFLVFSCLSVQLRS